MNSPVFADAFYYFAVLDPSDPAHVRAIARSKTIRGPIYTTEWVLTEVADGFARTAVGRREFVALIGGLMRPGSGVRVVPSDASLFADGVSLYAKRPDKAWSLTDCISFVVMDEERISDALTGDRHFEQAGFVALLK